MPPRGGQGDDESSLREPAEMARRDAGERGEAFDDPRMRGDAAADRGQTA
jgi:hypothetical protein